MSASDTFRFNPPLYTQRYLKVLDILSLHKPSKVIDFGCAECNLIRLLKSEDYVEEICGVDLNRDLLESSKQKIEPLTSDYINPRTLPLTISLVQASVLAKTEAFTHFDAVTCIELIEHLFQSELPALEENIFGFIKPKLAIISTPNSEFNVVFPDYPKADSKFRHWDHKFEWSRGEFESWCGRVCRTYSYSVEYDGVGYPPSDKNNLGFCSQFAIFQSLRRECVSPLDKKSIIFKDLVAVSVHPYRPLEEQEEIVLFKAFCFFLDSLSSAISSLLASLKKKDALVHASNMQQAFADLNLNANMSRPAPFGSKRNMISVQDSEQFVDVNGDGTPALDTTLNLYGIKYHNVVVGCFDRTYDYLRRLRDLTLFNRNYHHNFGQYDDSEMDYSRHMYMTKPLAAGNFVKDTIVNLSDCGYSLNMPVRITDIVMRDDKDSRNHIIVYRKSDFIMVPIEFILEMEDIKAHNGSACSLRSLVQRKGPEGVELSPDDDNILIVDMQLMDTFGRFQRSPATRSCSCSSTTSDDEENCGSQLRTYTDEDFCEENWDND